MENTKSVEKNLAAILIAGYNWTIGGYISVFSEIKKIRNSVEKSRLSILFDVLPKGRAQTKRREHIEWAHMRNLDGTCTHF